MSVESFKIIGLKLYIILKSVKGSAENKYRRKKLLKGFEDSKFVLEYRRKTLILSSFVRIVNMKLSHNCQFMSFRFLVSFTKLLNGFQRNWCWESKRKAVGRVQF
jgi:hypothetical protein